VTSLAALNACERDAFVAAVGFAFEESPWVAERAWGSRPFATLDALHAQMADVVAAASGDEQVALIAAHPDLAGRVAREGRLTAASSGEQRSAGLDALTPDEVARFDALNAAYRERFGFPFVICAREHDKASILSELDRRTGNERATEISGALAEIARIARYRLREAVGE
jgi:OHCU decarboxylase